MKEIVHSKDVAKSFSKRLKKKGYKVKIKRKLTIVGFMYEIEYNK